MCLVKSLWRLICRRRRDRDVIQNVAGIVDGRVRLLAHRLLLMVEVAKLEAVESLGAESVIAAEVKMLLT